MKHLIACLSAAALLLALPQVSHADQFTQIQSSPNTYWVPTGPAASADPKDVVSAPAPSQAAPPPPSYYAGPGPYAYYYPRPTYVVAPAPYYYGPPRGYYAPAPAYYGPPPVSVGYYGGYHGSHVVVGIPGLFFGFHFH